MPTIYKPRQPQPLSLGVVKQQPQQPNMQVTTQVHIPTPRVQPTDINREVIWGAVCLFAVVLLVALVAMRWNHG